MSVLFAAVGAGEAVAAFLLISLALLGVGFLIWWRGGNFETKLILLGIVVVIAAVGYGGLLGVGAAEPTMMKLGVLMVLGGIAAGLLEKMQACAPQDNRKPQG